MGELRKADQEYQDYVSNIIAYSQQLQRGEIEPLKSMEEELKSFHDEVFADLMVGAADATNSIKKVQTEMAENHKNITNQLLDDMTNAARGSEAEWKNAANGIVVTMPQKINKAAEWVREQWGTVGQDVVNLWEGVSMKVADSIIGAIKGTRGSIAGIAQSIGTDFARYFLKKAIFSLSGGLLGFFGGLFDNPKNDAMAAQQGYDFGRYFAEGANRALSRELNFGVVLAGGSGGDTIINNFNGPMTDKEFIRRDIIPEIERAAERRISKLAIRNQLSTRI